MFCSACGVRLDDDARYCHSCGQFVGESLPLRQEPAPEPAPAPGSYQPSAPTPPDPRSEPKAPRSRIPLFAALAVVVVLAVGVAVAVLAFAPWENQPADEPAAMEAETDAAAGEAPEGEQPEPTAITGERRELLEYLALSYWAAVGESSNAPQGDLVADADASLFANLLYELVYPGPSKGYLYSTEYLLGGERFVFEKGNLSTESGFYQILSEEDGRLILASYLGEENVPGSEDVIGELAFYDGENFLIRPADGGFSYTVESSEIEGLGDTATFDCEFIFEGSDGSELERTRYRVQAVVDEDSLFGYHLVSMQPDEGEVAGLGGETGEAGVSAASALGDASTGFAIASVPIPVETFTYQNARYGYSMEIPISLSQIEDPANSSGAVFGDAFAMTITLWGENNILGMNAEQRFNQSVQGCDVEYSFVQGDFFVASYVEDGTVYYVKEYVGAGSVCGMQIAYPYTAKGEYDLIVEQIAPTFKPGDLAEAC